MQLASAAAAAAAVCHTSSFRGRVAGVVARRLGPDCRPPQRRRQHLRGLGRVQAAAASSASAASATTGSGSMTDHLSKLGRTAMSDLSEDGAFKRKEASFRDFITADGSSGFPAEAGRYHLYISYACPWASRCMAFRALKGLEDAIDVTVTKAMMEKTRPDDDSDTHSGWGIPSSESEEPGATPDPVNHCTTIRQVYEQVVPDYDGRYTVPVLFDKVKKTIVSNESSEIIRMFNSEFSRIAKKPDHDYYPEHLRKEIDEVNAWVYDGINNGVYKSGFAIKQGAYEEANRQVFESLDRVEDILSKQRYLVGNYLTEADIRLFMTLIRFDEVYAVHFKCNKKRIREYPNMFNYTKEIYQLPGIAATVNMEHIKNHYYKSHPQINPFKIVPLGPDIDYTQPHDRDRFPATS